MKTIKPLPITNSVLASSSVAETDYPQWSIGTTYGVGDYVIYTNPSSTVTVSNGSPAIISWTNNGLAVGDSFSITTTGTLPTGIVAGKEYYIVSIVSANNFTVSDSLNGTPISTISAGSGVHTATATIHKIYQSLVVSNVGNKPLTSPTYWVDTGATNRWRMFDKGISSKTVAYGSITISLSTTERVDSVALFGLSADTVEIVVTDPTEGVVYDETYSMVSDSGVVDWYTYFFTPVVRKGGLVVTELPPYSGGNITITLSSIGGTVECGSCVLGQARYWGEAQLGMTVGIQDYSIKTRDAYGNYVIQQRAFNKRADISIYLDNLVIDEFQTQMANFRAIPIVYVSSTTYESGTIYGFYKDFAVNISYPTMSVCTMTLEGLS